MDMQLLGPVYLVGGQDYNRVYLDWPANDCNCYLVDTGDTLFLVDCGCGDSLAGILDNIKKMDVDLRDVTHLFLTHAHLPHAGAAELLRRNGIQVVAHPETVRAAKEGGAATAAYHYHRRFLPLAEATEINDGQTVGIGACEIKALHLPGHCPGATAYEVRFRDRRVLFCGDVVRAPHLEQHRDRLDYDHDAYLKSLLRLMADPADILYPGHGPVCLSRGDHWIGEELKKLLAHSR